MQYEELIEKITNEIIKNISSLNLKKTSWDEVAEKDLSFGGTLKVFSSLLGTENIDIIIGEFKKGEGLKKHFHKKPTEEIYYILEGEIEVTIEGKTVTARKGDILSVAPEVIHWPFNNKDKICRILFILSPRESQPPVIV